MGWIEIVSLVLNLVLGTGFIVSIATLNSERRKRSAEADGVESDVYEKQIASANKRVDEAYIKLQKVQEVADIERKKWAKIAREISDIMLELEQERAARKIAEWGLCKVVGCRYRDPPRKESGLIDKKQKEDE